MQENKFYGFEEKFQVFLRLSNLSCLATVCWDALKFVVRESITVAVTSALLSTAHKRRLTLGRAENNAETERERRRERERERERERGEREWEREREREREREKEREKITATRYGSQNQTKKNELVRLGIDSEPMAIELALRRSNHWVTKTHT